MITLLKNILSRNHTHQTAAASPRDNLVAACVLLLEAAHADDDCSDQEMAHLVNTLQKRHALDDRTLTELLAQAHSQRDNAIDLWQFTNQLNQQLSKAEKLTLLEDIWRLIFADGHLEAHEDHFAHKLANLLRLSHRELIEAKLAAKTPTS